MMYSRKYYKKGGSMTAITTPTGGDIIWLAYDPYGLYIGRFTTKNKAKRAIVQSRKFYRSG